MGASESSFIQNANDSLAEIFMRFDDSFSTRSFVNRHFPDNLRDIDFSAFITQEQFLPGRKFRHNRIGSGI